MKSKLNLFLVFLFVISITNKAFSQNNPVENRLFVKANVPELSLTVYDMAGRQLIKKKMDNSEISIDMSRYPSGVYLGVLEKDGYRRTLKVIKR